MTTVTIISPRKKILVNNTTRVVKVIGNGPRVVKVSPTGRPGPPGPERDPVTIDLALLYQISKL